MDGIILPNLSPEDINKLDDLFNFLKTELVDNKKEGFFMIGLYCEQKWGKNHTLYKCFAETLADNGLTDTQRHKGERYIWGQKLNQNGIAFDGFKNEYAKQGKLKRKQQTDETLIRWKLKLDVIKIPFLIVSLIVSVVWNVVQFYNSRDHQKDKEQLKMTIDSLNQELLNYHQATIISNEPDTMTSKKENK